MVSLTAFHSGLPVKIMAELMVIIMMMKVLTKPTGLNF
jgi:hypothetical protein